MSGKLQQQAASVQPRSDPSVGTTDQIIQLFSPPAQGELDVLLALRDSAHRAFCVIARRDRAIQYAAASRR